MEKVRTLAQISVDLRKRCLDDDLGARYLAPGYRNALAGIRGPPPSESNHDIGATLSNKAMIDPFEFRCNFKSRVRIELIRIEEYNVLDSILNPIAKDMVRSNHRPRVVQQRFAHLNALGVHPHRPNLKETNIGRQSVVSVKSYCKLDLDILFKDTARSIQHLSH